MVFPHEPLLQWADYAGTAVFATTGVLASTRKRMDLVGAVVLAIVTATGGGTLRDLLTGALPVFWIRQPIYLLIAAITALVVFGLVHVVSFPRNFLQIPDAIGLALYTWLGCEKAHLLGLPEVAMVLMGVMTGTAGGMIRDVLSGEIPFILLKGELYAAASALGAIALVICWHFGLDPFWSAGICMGIVLLLRLAAIRWNISLPSYQGKVHY
jgi:uncharacterized membrane protein YeiH